jgi:tRNA G18 (ribose-2'-O)-methylase SpoU
MPVIPVDRLDDPQIAPYRDLKFHQPRHHRRWFVVEGLSLTERLLASRLSVLSVLTEERFAEGLVPRLPAATPVYTAPLGLITQLAGYEFHRGVLACGGRPANPELDTLLADAQSPAVLAVCVGIQDPENLGKIIRSSAALGTRAVLVGPGCTEAFSRRVARTSMGAIFRLPIRRVRELRADLETLRARYGVQLVATVLDNQAEWLAEFAPAARTALLFGNEGFGLAPDWMALCDRRVTIPMHLGIDSLNVSVAAGIFLYHFSVGGRSKSLRPESQWGSQSSEAG